MCLLFLQQPSAATDAKSELSRDAQLTLYAAQELLKKKDYVAALEMLGAYMKEAEVEGETVPVAAYIMLGNAAYAQGDTSKAATVFTEAVTRHPTEAPLRLNLAISLSEAEQHEASAREFREAFRIFRAQGELRPELLHHAAVGHYRSKKIKKALKDLDDLWALNPADIQEDWAQLRLHLLLELQSWKRAEKVLSTHLQKYKTDRDKWLLLSQVRMNQNKFRLAASALEIANSISALNVSELTMLADLYFYLDAPLNGAALLEKARGTALKANDMDMLANAYVRALRMDRAIEYAVNAYEAEPTHTRLLALARWLSEAGKNEALLSLAEENASDDSPGELFLLAGLAAIDVGRTEAADAWLHRAAMTEDAGPQARAWLNMLHAIDEARREAQAVLAGDVDFVNQELKKKAIIK